MEPARAWSLSLGLSILLSAIGVALFVFSKGGAKLNWKDSLSRQKSAWAIMGLTVGFILCFDRLGFVPTSGLYLFLLFYGFAAFICIRGRPGGGDNRCGMVFIRENSDLTASFGAMAGFSSFTRKIALMDAFVGLYSGFQNALTLHNIYLCFIGCLWGSMVGVLPGIGPLAGITLLIPITYGIEPTGAIIMLAGIYYGAMYGGSTTSILLNIPGESASVVTCLDGYQMALRGRAGAALFIAAIGSWIGGTISIVGVMLLSPVLADIATKFGPSELFALLMVALLLLSSLGTASFLKTLAMIIMGMLAGTVGMDTLTGLIDSPTGSWTFTMVWGLFPWLWGCSESGKSFRLRNSLLHGKFIAHACGNF